MPNGGYKISQVRRNNRATNDELRSVGSNSRNAGVSNVYSVTSGFPTRNVQSRVGDNRDVPVSKKPRFKTNNDIFGPGLEALQRYGR